MLIHTPTSYHNCKIFVTCQFPVVVDCGPLDSPANGMVNTSAGTLFEQVATYTCISGFMLNGVPSRECERSGEWSNEAPTCQGSNKVYL